MSASAMVIKCLIVKLFIAANLPLKLFSAIVANAVWVSLLFDIYVDYMLVKFEHNRMVQNIQIFELLKPGFLKSIFNTIWKDVYVAETIVYCLSVSLKSTILKMKSNQVKSCSRYGRPNLH